MHDQTSCHRSCSRFRSRLWMEEDHTILPRRCAFWAMLAKRPLITKSVLFEPNCHHQHHFLLLSFMQDCSSVQIDNAAHLCNTQFHTRNGGIWTGVCLPHSLQQERFVPHVCFDCLSTSHT